MRAIIKKTFMWLGLLAAVICQLQPAKAQSLVLVSRETDAAAYQPVDGNGDITSRERANESAAASGGFVVEPSKTEKRGQIQLSISTADSEKGITGIVEDKVTGAKITFESKRAGNTLISKINNGDGVTLIEYIEAQQELAPPSPDGPMQLEWAPWLRINGVEYKGYEGEVVEEMKSLAVSPEGRLVRYLAFYLVFHFPGHDLEQERRGLEVPYQAIQRFYGRSYKKDWAADFGRAELEAAAINNKPAEDFQLVPADCRMPNCKFVDTLDYQLTEPGGFVVKSLSPRLTLSHNYARPEPGGEHHDPAGIEGGRMALMDDDSQVGDCFGRCFAGCGGWSHEWIGSTVVDSYTYCFDSSGNGGGPGLDCSQMCCSQEREVMLVSGTAVHITSGHVTPGAMLHDACCRSTPLGCWLNLLCYVEALAAADCFIPGLGWDETWSYVGPHFEGYDQATGVCCTSVGPIN